MPVVSETMPQPTAPEKTNGGSQFPAIAMALLLLGLSVLSSPHFVGRVLLLHRYRHNLEAYVYAVAGTFLALALAAIVWRRPLNGWFGQVFPSKKEVALAGIVMAFSCGLAALAAEGAARILNYPFRPMWVASENPLATFDPEVGWAYLPNHSVTQEFGSDHRQVAMYFDDVGCRVQGPGLHADRSAPAALFVGDSFTFGHGVTFEESFVGQISAARDFPLHAVNLGIQAYGTDQSLLLLKRQFRKFNTKLVVFTFTNMQIDRNAFEDRRIQYPDGLFLGTKPRFGLGRDGSLYLADKAAEFKDLSYSHLWAALRVLEYRWGPPQDVRLTRALIEEMKRFVEANGAKFVVVDWYDDKDFPWGLDLDIVRIGHDAPAGFYSWVIPGDPHPDVRAHEYAAKVIAAEVTRVLNNTNPVSARGQS